MVTGQRFQNVKKACRVWLVVYLSVLGSAGCAATGVTMESSRMRVSFDVATGEPKQIVNLLTGNSLALRPKSAFILEMDVATIDARDCTLVSREQQGSKLTSVYSSREGNITVTYSLGPDDHFVQKSIRFEPSFAGAYVVRNVCVAKFRFSPVPSNLISFRHGTSVTHFVRGPQAFFFGVQVPVYEKLDNINGSIELGYPANYRYPAGSACEAEKSFWGVYKPQGTCAPKVPEMFKECRQSTIPPDVAESDAMIKMVQKVAETTRTSIAASFNGWDFDLLKNGFRTPAKIEEAKDTLGKLKSWLGDVDFTVSLATTWGGMCYEMNDVNETDTEPPASPEMLDFTAWCKANGIKLENWEPLKGIHPWFSLNRYCDDYVPWRGDCDVNCGSGYGDGGYNCPANRAFMAWLTNMIIKNCRHSRAYGFALDEAGPHPRTALPCRATGHDHEPGDAAYGYFCARRELFHVLRKEFGPEFLLWAGRPQQDAGIWDMLYLDGVMTLSEVGPGDGDTIRQWARIRYYYHFMPSYIDQATLKDCEKHKKLAALDSYNDYQLLSALATSNFYLFIDAPDANQVERVRYWLSWANDHKELMRTQTIFLPDWPSSGTCDGYLRLKDGQGFAFVFNADQKPHDMVIPLDENVGLDGARSYCLEEVFPKGSGARVPRRAEGNVTVRQVPPRTALLLSVKPFLIAD